MKNARVKGITMLTDERITLKNLKELLDYNPETGIFKWKFKRQGTQKTDFTAGYLRKDGYVRICLNKNRYMAHRLAWLYMNGMWPKGQIDHIDHNRSNNKLCNLREVSHQENHKNKGMNSNNTSGVTGVCWITRINKWASYIMIDGKNKYLGEFKKFEEAVEARKKAEIKFLFHENHGK